MRRTAAATHGAYDGEKCPACPAILQPVRKASGKLSQREGLWQHWLVCHPERLRNGKLG